MAIPPYHEFMKPALKLLSDGNPEVRKNIYEKLALEFQLTDEERNELFPTSGQRIYNNRIGWALTYLKKAELISSPARSSFQITPTGIKAISSNPKVINNEFLRQYQPFRDFLSTLGNTSSPKPVTSQTIPDEAISPQERMDSAYNEITKSLASDILQEVMNQTPAFFEKLVVDLLVIMGYGGSKAENSQVLGKTGDEGIDGIIKEDKLGFDKIFIQAKRWDPQTSIGRPELQKFVGALTGQGASKGAFITTAKFTNDARNYVEQQRACKVVLINGQILAALMIEHNLGVSVENLYSIKKIDGDYFIE